MKRMLNPLLTQELKLSLSPSMREALFFVEKHAGRIRRYPGGFWTNPEKYEQPTFGTKTIEALVTRGYLFYSEWKQGRRGIFPIEAKLIIRNRAKTEIRRDGGIPEIKPRLNSPRLF